MTTSARPRLIVAAGGKAMPPEAFDFEHKARDRWAYGVRPVAAAFLCLFAVAVLARLWIGSVAPTDAVSRGVSALLVTDGRDPHLAAIGFVWSPLPTLLAIPLAPLRHLWPAMVEQGFAMIVVSCLCTALAVVELSALLRDLGLETSLRRALTLAFVLHPMILLYAINGMSEACFVCCLIFTCRALMQWLHTDELGSLVRTGLALAFAYLARYEAVPAGIAVVAVVAIVSVLRSGRDRATRLTDAGSDALVVALPLVFTVAVWAFASWVIVGHPFDSFSSQYGNSRLLKLDAGGLEAVVGRTVPAKLGYLTEQVVGLSPLLLLIVAAAVVFATRTRDLRVYGPLAVFGAVSGAQALGLLSGATFGVLRFQITLIPLALVLLATVLAGRPEPQRRISPNWVVASILLVALTSTITMNSTRLGREEYETIDAVQHGVSQLDRWESAREVAAYVDRELPPDRLVLIDQAVGFAIIAHTRRLQSVATTADLDFKAVVADPISFSVGLIVVPEPTGANRVDAITTAYPQLFDNGTEFAQLVLDVPAKGNQPHWRVFKVR